MLMRTVENSQNIFANQLEKPLLNYKLNIIPWHCFSNVSLDNNFLIFMLVFGFAHPCEIKKMWCIFSKPWKFGVWWWIKLSIALDQCNHQDVAITHDTTYCDPIYWTYCPSTFLSNYYDKNLNLRVQCFCLHFLYISRQNRHLRHIFVMLISVIRTLDAACSRIHSSHQQWKTMRAQCIVYGHTKRSKVLQTYETIYLHTRVKFTLLDSEMITWKDRKADF